jgi:DNA-binding SARP family transcriptional activator
MPVDAMKFRILGPVEAIAPGGEALPCSGRPLKLLALLLVDGSHAVPADVAIEALWGDGLPANPPNALQITVSRLRNVLGEESVVRRADGYELRLGGPDSVDAERFERLASEGREALARGDTEHAARLLAQALELWRGPALQDVRYEPFATREAERLEELRLTCLGARIDADLALGRHAELVGELQALVAEHPLKESLRAQLMLALYRSGRQADALAAYADARKTLTEELGLEPSPELRALERDILRHRVDQPARAKPVRRELVCVAAEVRATRDGAPLDPEVLHDVMGTCHDAMEVVAREHGSPLRELRESGMIAVFGAPAAHEDDALRAQRTARALRQRLGGIAATLASERGIVLEARTGVAAGTALIAEPGRLPRGDVVEAAIRLARDANAGEIATDARTRALLLGLQTAYESPLVGREDELGVLEDAFERAARQRAPQLVTVIGEPGIGKSRLARELATRLHDRATVLEGHCPAYGLGVTYWPVREMVVQAAAGRPLEALTAALEDGAAAAASVAGTLGLGESAPGEATPWAFRRLFAAITTQLPLVLQFEDVHWAERPLLDLIDDLAARLTDAPVLLLCLARPEILAARPRWADGALRLGPLHDTDSRRLLAARPGLSDGQRSAVAQRAGGNPLFLEQLAVHVAEHETSLPPALHALLAARLDLLAPRERALLDAAAVEGGRFHLGGVCAIVEDVPPGDARASLDALVDRELLVPAPPEITGEQAWRFRHALVRDAAYASMPKATRAQGHERLARWLAANQARVPEADALIGNHLDRAHRAAAELGRASPELAAEAAKRLADAGGHAHRRGDLPSEIALLSRAVELLGEDDPARGEPLAALAVAHFETGTLEDAVEAAEAAVALGDRLGLERVRRRAAVELERVRAFRHPEAVEPAAAIAVTSHAIAALRELGDDLGLARAHIVHSELVWLTGSLDASYRNAERAVQYARRARSGFEIDSGVSFMAFTLIVNAVPVSEGIRRCAQLEREVSGRFAAMSVRGFRAVLDAMAGRFDPARTDLTRARAGLAELGLGQASVWMAMFDGIVEMLAGDPFAAERAFDEAERIAVDIGDRWFHSTIVWERALAALAQDRPGASAEAVARIDEIPAPGDIEWHFKRHLAQAKLAAQQGDGDRALSEARTGVRLADPTDHFVFRADAHRDLAEIAARFGSDEEARTELETALAMYRAKENVAATSRLGG